MLTSTPRRTAHRAASTQWWSCTLSLHSPLALTSHSHTPPHHATLPYPPSPLQERFFPFDLNRWREDRCTKNAAGFWECGWLQSKFADCPRPVVDLIEARFADRRVGGGAMLPFRRRDFEVDALVREIVRCASAEPSIAWGATLPAPAALASAGTALGRRLVFVGAESERARAVEAQLVESIARVAPATTWCPRGEGSQSATHMIALLSSSILDREAPALAALEDAVTSGIGVVFLYVEPVDGDAEAWDFGAFYKLPESSVTTLIAGHEALKWRAPGGALAYEHDALILELLKRMRRFQNSG